MNLFRVFFCFIFTCLFLAWPSQNVFSQTVGKVFFDIGANNGDSSIYLAKADPSTWVYAFEPTPEMYQLIEKKTVGLRNYLLIKKAVSDFEGTATFNVAGQADWGCSSLLEFSDKSKVEWPGRTDFVKTKEIQVEVIRLDRFVKENGITKIDYLHIDTQGSDLKVLQGLGDQLQIVQSGVLEAGTKTDILYYGQNTEEQCVKFLIENGFKITRIESNDRFGNEVNIYFSRI